MATKRIFVRMSGFLEGDEEIINELIKNAEYGDDVDFTDNEIKGLNFISDNEGYIPEISIEEYLHS